MKYGEFTATVSSLTLIASTERPAILTRLTTTDPEVPSITHTVRLHDPKSLRIGVDELRSAFPDILAGTDGESSAIQACLVHSRKFVGKQVTVSIEPQMKNGVIQKNPDTKEAYYNIRLRSAMHDLSEDLAAQVVKGLLAKVATESKLRSMLAEA